MINTEKNEFDERILIIDKAICENIHLAEILGEELLAQNIMAQLRNLVNAVAIRIYSDKDKNTEDYNFLKKAMKYIRSQSQYYFLNRFDKCLQPSVSHSTIDGEGSARLMLKYIEYLYDIRELLVKNYDLHILNNLENYPTIKADAENEYYQKISNEIERIPIVEKRKNFENRFYILKSKAFYINKKKYYELTLIIANDYSSKFDRIIAFTQLKIPTFYAVKLSFENSRINILNHNMSIKVINNFMVSIRPCEFNNFFMILGYFTNIQSSYEEYKAFMHYLTDTGSSLTEIIDLSDKDYDSLKNAITAKAVAMPIFRGLDKCRNFSTLRGHNVLRYLLYRLNNVVIKRQFNNNQCDILSNLFLKYGVIPFDDMPYFYSLINHNPKLSDLFQCIDSKDRKHELLARCIKNNTENNAKLYTHKDELTMFDNLEYLVTKFNSLLYYKHRDKVNLCWENNYLYINEYEKNTYNIINSLIELSSNGIVGYKKSVECWLDENPNIVDSDEKKKAIKNVFENSHVALIYGSAGTGKSYLINHISQFFKDKERIYLANTHTAVENLKRKISSDKDSFMTIRKYLTSFSDVNCDILFIDECSMVSNKDMIDIINKSSFELLVLVGDIYQIESIRYGNWFAMAKSFIAKTSIVELNKPYRTEDPKLLKTWQSVRLLDGKMNEFLNKYGYSTNLDETIFSKNNDDEIVLCLNYDGLYGINNINKFLQDNNPSEVVSWNMADFKIGDPIVFNETKRFNSLLYNNLKGRIIGIEKNNLNINFTIEIDKVLNEMDINGYDLILMESSNPKRSVISFIVSKGNGNDYDDDISSNYIVPFQVSYATSIHKAQGLEYESVKIVVTDEIEECITHNIFYTAITRSKKTLKIYWNRETEKNILENMELKTNNVDSKILANKYGLRILKK